MCCLALLLLLKAQWGQFYCSQLFYIIYFFILLLFHFISFLLISFNFIILRYFYFILL